MIINYKTRTIQIKIVYYGCALSGKTTSLRSLFRILNKPMELTSIETTTGRTLFFDFGTVTMKGNDWFVKFLLYSATGQDFYVSTRPATLSGADGIIFMIDSQRKFLHDNLISWKELHSFFKDNFKKIPIVICLNKQDLPNVIDLEQIQELYDLKTHERIDILKTIALNGIGVKDAFKSMVKFIFPSISIRDLYATD